MARACALARPSQSVLLRPLPPARPARAGAPAARPGRYWKVGGGSSSPVRTASPRVEGRLDGLDRIVAAPARAARAAAAGAARAAIARVAPSCGPVGPGPAHRRDGELAAVPRA